MLEIDFKVELIKQLLDRIDRVHAKGSLSRPAILQLDKGRGESTFRLKTLLRRQKLGRDVKECSKL